MNNFIASYYIAFNTILYKEVRRFMRIWQQTLLPPAITMTLYFIIFGSLIGSRIGEMSGLNYMSFIMPGLIMMSVINNAYSNVSSSFSLGGFINALYANKFDDVSIVPTFILTPLSYLGGVFFSTDLLPAAWQVVAQFNPILYMVNGFRYGMLGVSDVSLYACYGILICTIIVLYCYSMWLLKRGKGIRQ